MTDRRPVGVAEVVAAVERQLRGDPPLAVEGAPHPDSPPASAFGEFERRLRSFRQEPLGGRLLPLKRVLYWFVASAFDRQTKILEALEVALRQERARADALERRLGRLEAQLLLDSSGAASRQGEDA